MAEKLATELVHVGALKGPHGLKGLVKAHIALDDPELLLDGGPIVAENGRSWRVLKWQAVGQGLLALKLDGVDSIEQAETLRGIKIFMDPAAWPEADDDEVYVRDLVGVRVCDDLGSVLGVVLSVQELPAGSALLIECASDGKQRLVPIVDEYMTVGEQIILTEMGVLLLAL